MKRSFTYVAATLIFLLCACEHKELCFQSSHTASVRVQFDWDRAEKATPEGMCVFFYPVDGGSPQRFDFAGKKGGKIEISTGHYRVLCYNNDTESVLFDGMENFDTHRAYTRNGNVFEIIYGNAAGYAPMAKGTEKERVVICPDMMWGDRLTDVEIKNSAEEEQVVILHPAELICTYTYEVSHVKNLATVEQLCGSLSGMAPSEFLASEELERECVTIPFAAHSDGISRITGRFYTFGHHEANKIPHKMVFYVWFKGGTKYYYTVDVTRQVDQAPDRKHVHIIIEGLEFPQPLPEDGGFDVDVDEWINVDKDIIM